MYDSRNLLGGAHTEMDTAGNKISHRSADTVVQARGDQGQPGVVSGHQVEQAISLQMHLGQWVSPDPVGQ